MFSFFKSKKPSPDHTPAEPIPGPVPPAPKEDDFIIVEHKGSPGSAADSPVRGLYPSIPLPTNSMGNVPGAAVATATRQQSEEKTSHILYGVPFKLSPELVKDSNLEITQYQVNEILAFVNKVAVSQMAYDFSLERSVLSET
ncbi:uncharacterized protein LOC129717520 [Wyeomyia smithii]|uniref:uncharacterized protein LOC129717520 n=1 Tax=Wyeomyia smithii TaxID=174621 RepID=UPI002467BD34|nr:uncharacterized protein LOC129717520 [Wyeomyia smithii]